MNKFICVAACFLGVLAFVSAEGFYVPKAAFKLDAEGNTNDLHMINQHDANVLRRLRRSDNFVFSSSSSSSSSSSGNDGKVYFTQQTSHHTNANPSFNNRFGGDDSGSSTFAGNTGGFGGNAGGFGGNTGPFGAGGFGVNAGSFANAGFGSGGFVFDDYNNHNNNNGGSNFAGTSGSHFSGSGTSHQNSGSSGSGTYHNAGHTGSGSGSGHGNKVTGQTVITSGVIDNGKVHSKTDKINHYN